MTGDTCWLCGPKHSPEYHELKQRDFDFQSRMAQAKMRATERAEHEAAREKIERMTHKGVSVGSGEDTRRRVRELTDDGMSKLEIADKLSISVDTVAKARKATRG